MTQDRNVTAVFDDKLYNLVVNPHGNGSVAIDGTSINEGNFTYGTIVSIEATPRHRSFVFTLAWIRSRLKFEFLHFDNFARPYDFRSFRTPAP